MADEHIEIPRQQAAMQQSAYNLLNSLFTGKEAVEFKRLLKKHDPEGKFVKTTDLDLADTIAAPIKEEIKSVEDKYAKLLERMDAKEKADKENALLTDMHAKIDATASTFKLTDEGKKGMIKVMQERQLADPEAAAALYLRSIPPAEPAKAADASRYLPSRANLFDGGLEKGKGDPAMEEWWKDREGTFDRTVAQILNEEAA